MPMIRHYVTIDDPETGDQHAVITYTETPWGDRDIVHPDIKDQFAHASHADWITHVFSHGWEIVE